MRSGRAQRAVEEIWLRLFKFVPRSTLFDLRVHDGPPYIRARCAACAPRAQLFLANPFWRGRNEEKKISAEAFLTFGALRHQAPDAQRLRNSSLEQKTDKKTGTRQKTGTRRRVPGFFVFR